MIWMSQDREPRKNDTDRENDREPDQPQGHLVGMAGGSLADPNYWRRARRSWPRWPSTRYWMT